MRTGHTTHQPTSLRTREPRRRAALAACAVAFALTALAITDAAPKSPRSW
jgi:hypothetical protein